MNRKLKKAVLTTTTTNPSTTTQPEIVLRITEYGKRFGVTERTVYKWLAMGLPHLKPNRKIVRIPVPEADAWMRQTFLRQRERS